ncbi:hypothetical protein TIN2_37 [Tsukamurella phage TIN2]|uniref:PD-(D/E)XK endonuclease-like domain-containing protein n=1 Tax=Tsukamurella phage TIN2 TaxID=1636545 RepID=A0A0K0N5P3_9CAUD|nr:hypothetical protein AVT55_gp086 [Tsukamurella phage TIN2]AKJ71727.1 hypothetical protein TIN2_37 [Tsukamurella phage TIN2]
MKLTTISASSLQTFEGCTHRFFLENVQRTPTPGGSSNPAKLGSAVHDTLERVVTESYVDKVCELEWTRIVAYFKQEFMKQFQTVPDVKNTWYADGLDMLERWFERTNLENVEVLMVEKKVRVPIKTSIGDVPYTFIFDRLDRFEEDGKVIIRVVDYKTWRQVLTSTALREKPQARLYGMAIQLAFKELAAELGEELKPDEIWVCFDQLRYDTAEVRLTRDDNIETWKYVRRVAERIIAEPDPGRRTLNSECQFCVAKSTCPLVTKNVDAGGIMAIQGDRNEMAKRFLELDGAAKAIKYAIDEIVEEMLKDAMDQDEVEYDTEDYSVEFKSSRRKSYEPAKVREIVGDAIFAQMDKVTNAEVEKLLKGAALSPSQKSLLRSSVKETISEPKPKIVKKMK